MRRAGVCVMRTSSNVTTHDLSSHAWTEDPKSKPHLVQLKRELTPSIHLPPHIDIKK